MESIVKLLGSFAPLQNELEHLEQCVELGLIQPKEGANRSIDRICDAFKLHKFTMPELTELLEPYGCLSVGLAELILCDFR